MKPRAYPMLAIVLLYTLLFSCRKENNSGGFNYDFENLSDKAINIDIYTSLDDYNKGINILMHGRAAVRGYFAIPISKFVNGHTYYVDWYSDDYLYTNWYWTNVTLRTRFEPGNADDRYMINVNQFADPSRAFWMNGMGTQSIWKLTNAYTTSGNNFISVWPQLTGDQQQMQITLRKDFSASIEYVDTASHATRDTMLVYKANYDATQNISVVTIYDYSHNTTFATLKSNFSPVNYNFTGNKSNILVTFPGQRYYYLFTRQ